MKDPTQHLLDCMNSSTFSVMYRRILVVMYFLTVYIYFHSVDFFFTFTKLVGVESFKCLYLFAAGAMAI